VKLHHIAFGNIKRRKAKVLFLLSGLLIGISTIVALLAITESMSRDIEERLDQFGANIVLVPRSENLSLNYGGISVGGVNYQVTEFDEAEIEKIRAIENANNLGAVAPKVLGAVALSGRKALLMGVDFETELALKSWWHLDGSPPRDGSEILVGSDAAAMFQLAPGSRVVLGEREMTVAAVIHPTGGQEDNILVADFKAAQEILGKQGKVSMVEIVAFCRDCPIDELVLQIAEKFPNGKVTALRQAVMAKMQSIELFKTFSYGVALLVIGIGSLLVFVTMMGSVNERTREIGIFRAIGFRRGHVMQVFLLEATLVGFLAGILGTAGGNLLGWLALPWVLPGGAFAGTDLVVGLGATVMAVVLSLLASFYPAHKGSGLDPSEALRAL